MPDDTSAEDIEAKFEEWYKQRAAKDRQTAERRTEPKDFGEFLDRVRDEVVDALWERMTADDDESAPGGRSSGETRPEGAGTKVARWYKGEGGAKTA